MKEWDARIREVGSIARQAMRMTARAGPGILRH
jgi:hypothetical protein